MFKKIRKIIMLNQLSNRLFAKVEDNHRTMMALRDAPQPKNDGGFFLELRGKVAEKSMKVVRRFERVEHLRKRELGVFALN